MIQAIGGEKRYRAQCPRAFGRESPGGNDYIGYDAGENGTATNRMTHRHKNLRRFTAREVGHLEPRLGALSD
jgi:hypothetical protein